MKIRFLGTAASEGWPGVFCRCDSCKKAEMLGGKNIRTRCSIHVNDIHKIDLPPDTYCHRIKYGLNLSRLRHLLITHSHPDHFCCQELRTRGEPFARIEQDRGLTVYGNAAVGKILKGEPDLLPPPVEFSEVKPFRGFDAGGLRVYPLRADHAGEEDAVFYLLESRQKKRALIANDTGWPPGETIEFLSDFRLDFASFDATGGELDSRRGHMGIAAVAELKDLLTGKGAVDSSTRCFATHFSHNGGLLHEQLQKALRPHAIEPAYDGLIVDF